MPVRNFLKDIGQGTQNALQQLAFIEKARAMQPGSQENKLRQLQMQQAEAQMAMEPQRQELERQKLAQAQQRMGMEGQRYEAEQAEMDRAKRMEGTKWMLQATQIAMDEPQTLPHLLSVGQQKGFIDPNMTPDQVTPGMLQELHNQARMEMPGFGAKRGAETEKTRFSRAKDLRSELAKETKTFKTSRDAYDRMLASNTGTPAGDLALIFNFMKVLDPGSTVREGEFKTAADAKAWLAKKDEEGYDKVPNQIRTIINKATEGTILLDEQRPDFMKVAEDMFRKVEARKEGEVFKILSIGKRFGVPREDILGEKQPKNKPLSASEKAELKALEAEFGQ